MDFRFNLQPIFTQPIVKVNSNLLPNTFRGDRRAALDTTTKMAEIINTMGELSAKAQGLNKPVTTAQKLRMSDQNIYLLGDPETGKAGSVIGLLKVGKKSLYVFDENGETKMVNAPCVLDFYVHESRQRSGLGREIFETMLQEEKCAPEKMAVDRPSDKLLGFLKKHYGLQRTIPQMNNFVVYEGFFDRPTANNNIESGDGGVHLTDSPNTALFGPQFTNDDKRRPKPQQKGSTSNISQISSSPVGRYAAPRPMCSMAECLRSDGVQQQVVRSTSKTSIHSKAVNQNISNVSQEHNQDQNNYPVQETQVCPQYCATHGSPVEKPSEIIRTCQPCGCGGHIVHTEIHPVPQNILPPCQLENVVVPLNNISSEINNNIIQQQQQQQVEESGILSPQEIANKILLEKKLALKRSGLQGTTMDQYCPSNTSIQTSGMDTECIGGYGNEQVYQNVPPPSDNGNRVVPSMSKITSAVVSNESKSGLQAGGYVNPSEPVEQAQVQIKSTETHSQVGPNNVEVTPEEFQEVCPKCSTTFLSSRAASTMKGNNLQARASLLSQKSVHQTNDTIIHNTATPAGGEPNSEESSQLTEEHSDDIISSLNVELESLQVDVNQTDNSLEESQLDQTAANGHSHHDDDEEQLHEHEIDDEIDGDKIHLADADDEHIKKSNYNKQHTGLKNVSYNVGMAVTPTSKMEFDQEEPESFGIVKINRPIGKATSPTDNTDAESHVSSEGYTDQGYLDLKFYHNRLW